MKKKIMFVVVIVAFLFTAGGAYIIGTIQKATTELDYLVKLYQVEMKREQLLLQIKNVQTDLLLSGTSSQRDMATVVTNLKSLEKFSGSCFECHHTPGVQNRLDGLVRAINGFQVGMTRSLMFNAQPTGWGVTKNAAFRTTEALADQVKQMVHITSQKLSEQTGNSLADITGSKLIIYVLVILTPLVAGGLSYFFIRAFTRPVRVLLEATQHLKDGELDFQIKGLTNEFGMVATSFNQMALALNTHLKQIQASEKRYRMLFENAADAIFIMEAEGEQRGKIVAANRAAAEMHGYSRDELQKRSIQELDSPEAAAKAPERIERILRGEWIHAEIDHRRKDGSIFPVEISAGLLHIDGHRYVLAFDRDITERKEMESLILQAKQDWEDTFNNITDMIIICDPRFNIVRANNAARQMLDLPAVADSLTVKCHRYLHGQQGPSSICQSCESWKTGQPGTYEYYEPHLDRMLEVRTMPQFDDNEQMCGLIHVIRDITERRRVEASLQRAEQMKLVGEWATSLAHEIKNPLAGIKLSIEALLENPDLSKDDTDIVFKAVDEIKRIQKLLKNILNFAKPPKPQFITTDMNDLLEKTVNFSLRHPSLAARNAAQLNVSKYFDPALPKMRIDPMQLQQIVMNLIFNAIEAMPRGGRLSVASFYAAADQTVSINISDTGTGIEKKLIDEIFKPFFTTKKKGSGLGLAITKRLVECNNGRISIESEAGKGTVFRIVFPLKGTGSYNHAKSEKGIPARR